MRPLFLAEQRPGDFLDLCIDAGVELPNSDSTRQPPRPTRASGTKLMLLPANPVTRAAPVASYSSGWSRTVT
jgi:hypothetical protein